jgi:hypothetical protein
MSRNKSEKVIEFFSTVREEYENRIGWKLNTDSRLRVQVEARVAFANAIRPYGTLTEVAVACGKKDHTTIVHSMKSHESHFAWSPNYRSKYKTAIESVRDVATLNDVDPYFNEYTLSAMQDDIKTIESILAINKEAINKFYEESIVKKTAWRDKIEREILSLQNEVA